MVRSAYRLGSWARSRSRSATSPRAVSTPSARSPACSVDIAAVSCSCASAGSRSTCSRTRPSTPPRSTWSDVRVVAAGTQERRSPGRLRPRRLLGLELATAGGTASSIRSDCRAALARALRAPLRHRRGQRDLLPPADREGGPGLGRPDTRPLRLRVKLSRYVTHVKRLREPAPSLELFYERIEPLVRSASSAPSSGSCRRPSAATTSARQALRAVPSPLHRVPAPSWFAPDVMALLRAHGVALVIGDRPEVRAFQSHD